MAKKQYLSQWVGIVISLIVVALFFLALNIGQSLAAYEIEDTGPQSEKQVEEPFEAPRPCVETVLARFVAPTPGETPCETMYIFAKQVLPWSFEIATDEPYEDDCVGVYVKLARYVEVLLKQQPL